jgi:hypothetical protein
MAAGAALAVALTGCAYDNVGAAPEPTVSAPSPSQSPVTWTAEPISGRGSSQGLLPDDALSVPDWARSVVMEFTCAGGAGYVAEIGNSMEQGHGPQMGTCDGTHELSWSVDESTGATLRMSLPPEVEWSALPRFSSEELVFDKAITAECERISAIYSALMNADDGLLHHRAFGTAEWGARVTQAAADLDALASSSETSLAEPFRQLHETVIAPEVVPGMLRGIPASDPSFAAIGEACNANHSPITMSAEFGG